MKITRNIFIILYAILLVINDPQVARAHTIEGIGISQAGIIENKPVYVDPYEETGQKAYHITYILSGSSQADFRCDKNTSQRSDNCRLSLSILQKEQVQKDFSL